MTAESILYRDLAYVFVVALLGGLVALRLRQPLIVGYVLGGIVIGPFTPGPTVSEMADLLRVKWVALVGGPLASSLPSPWALERDG